MCVKVFAVAVLLSLGSSAFGGWFSKPTLSEDALKELGRKEWATGQTVALTWNGYQAEHTACCQTVVEKDPYTGLERANKCAQDPNHGHPKCQFNASGNVNFDLMPCYLDGANDCLDKVAKPQMKVFSDTNSAKAFMDACPSSTCSDWKQTPAQPVDMANNFLAEQGLTLRSIYSGEVWMVQKGKRWIAAATDQGIAVTAAHAFIARGWALGIKGNRALGTPIVFAVGVVGDDGMVAEPVAEGSTEQDATMAGLMVVYNSITKGPSSPGVK